MIDRGRVVIEYLIGIGLRAPRGRQPLHRKQVLRGVWNPVQWSSIVAAMDLFLRCLCLFEGNFRGQPGVSVKAWSEFLAAVEIGLRQIDRRELLCFDAFREFAYREIEKFVARHSGRSSGTLGCTCRFRSRQRRRGLLFALHQRFQIKTWSISVIACKRTQTFERWLRLSGQSPNIGFRSGSEPAPVFSEDRLNSGVDLDLAFRR